MAGLSTIVEYLKGDGDVGYRCGYCKNPNGSFSRGMWAHRMTCQDYEDLIDRGWRRSGKYVYKPTMKKSCCPPYTIRCDSTEFRLSKSQKKVLKKFVRYVASGSVSAGEAERQPDKKVKTARNPDSTVKGVSASKSDVRPGVGADPDKLPCRKAKDIRRERKLAKQQASASTVLASSITVSNESKEAAVLSKSSDSTFPAHGQSETRSLEDWILTAIERKDTKHKLTVSLVLCNTSDAEFQASYEETYQLFKIYQMTIHKETEEDSDRKQFKRFLVDSPLIFSRSEDGPSTGYGSFHQQYRLDGRLIAVGVLDILPHCVSSVYFFYDPEFGFLSLGVYSALREILVTRQLYQATPQLKWYYMGYYIHSCEKMSYKGQYYPSYLLCPEVLTWVPIAECVVKLDMAKFSRLDDHGQLQEPPLHVTLPKVTILSRQEQMTYEVFEAIYHSKHQDVVKDYISVVGPITATRMLLYLHS
ncbi:arginyl-tRNA--protein transferase 1-like [Corticium candelabrum]|uniref:arginyl-tRNA--protein transferase 1-like n=1 Tax=Corticium candelabrum TaxID=121492 RepID=UPI002E255E35|nr:arginyl-tRNA--protein transferase 1-like [Corticium candelabrum]